MKSNKKGQGAMEYLMTYGWAIIVVMIVGLALWNLGIFNLGKTYPKGFSGFSGVRPLDWGVSEKATADFALPCNPMGWSVPMFRMTLVNAEGGPIEILGITADGQCTTYYGGGQGEKTLGGPNWKVQNNELKVVYFNTQQPGSCDTPTYDIACNNIKLGDPYKFKLTIRYNKSIDKDVTIIHNSVGYIWGTFEKINPPYS